MLFFLHPQNLSKLPGQLLILSQRSLLACASNHLTECLDTFKQLEIQATIFSQTELGDYSKGLCCPPLSFYSEDSFSLFSVEQGREISLQTSGLEVKDGGKGKRKGKGKATTLFELEVHADPTESKFYHENGLVLDTIQTMRMVADFVSSSLKMVKVSVC